VMLNGLHAGASPQSRRLSTDWRLEPVWRANAAITGRMYATQVSYRFASLRTGYTEVVGRLWGQRLSPRRGAGFGGSMRAGF
jgi:hypothetical protein